VIEWSLPFFPELLMKYFKNGVIGLMVLFIVLLSIQNLDSVNVSFLTWSMSLPKIVLILLAYVLGMITGWGLIDVIKRLVSTPKQ
jgi:putative membrane protein